MRTRCFPVMVKLVYCNIFQNYSYVSGGFRVNNATNEEEKIKATVLYQMHSFSLIKLFIQPIDSKKKNLTMYIYIHHLLNVECARCIIVSLYERNYTCMFIPVVSRLHQFTPFLPQLFL